MPLVWVNPSTTTSPGDTETALEVVLPVVIVFKVVLLVTVAEKLVADPFFQRVIVAVSAVVDVVAKADKYIDLKVQVDAIGIASK